MSEYIIVVVATILGAVGVAGLIWVVDWILEKMGL